MTKKELLARIEALEARVLALEANPYRLYPTVPVAPSFPWFRPYEVTCATGTLVGKLPGCLAADLTSEASQ